MRSRSWIIGTSRTRQALYAGLTISALVVGVALTAPATEALTRDDNPATELPLPPPPSENAEPIARGALAATPAARHTRGPGGVRSRTATRVITRAPESAPYPTHTEATPRPTTDAADDDAPATDAPAPDAPASDGPATDAPDSPSPGDDPTPPPSPSPSPSPTPSPTPKPSPTPVSVMSMNICGGVCHHGQVDDIARYVVRIATQHGAQVVTLQEVCRSQFDRISELAEDDGYSAFFARATDSGVCDDDDDESGTGFGVALLVRGNAWGRTVTALPTNPGYEKRVLLGVTATLGGRSTFVACVHTSPTAAAGLDRQLAVLADVLGAKAAKIPTIAAGDFNAMPGNPGFARLYSPAAGGTGRFTELDQTDRGTPSRSGEPTFDIGARKIDYIFASAAHFGSPRADSLPTSMSDHRVYLGSTVARR